MKSCVGRFGAGLRRGLFSLAIVSIVSLVTTAVSSAALRYRAQTLTSLGLPENAAMNDRGQIAGVAGDGRLLFFDGQTIVERGGVAPGGSVLSVTNAGEVLVVRRNGQQIAGYTLHTSEGSEEFVVNFPAGFSGGIYEMNDLRDTCGVASDGTANVYAFVTRGGTMTIEEARVGDEPSYAYALALNNRGEFVGQAAFPGTGTVWPAVIPGPLPVFAVYEAALWSGGTLRKLTLGGGHGMATKINDAGIGVGSSGTLSETHAFFYSDGQITDLGALVGHSHSSATFVSELGVVVGRSSTSASGPGDAFLWRSGRLFGLSAITDFSDAGILGFYNATAVSADGQILAWGYSDAAQTQIVGCLLTPIMPENETAPPLVNISGRMLVGTGDQIGIVGFIVGGEIPRKVLIRAVGPGLASFGVSGVLADPAFRLYREDQPLMGNDDWGSRRTTPILAEKMEQMHVFALEDGSKDAALLLELEPGSYTVHVGGRDGGTGVALLEVYSVP